MQILALRNTAKKPLVPNVPIVQPLCSVHQGDQSIPNVPQPTAWIAKFTR